VRLIDTPYFLDEDPVAASWNYYVVTAIYDSLDGAFSNEARAYIFDDEMMELAYDDGSCEAGLNVGIAQYMAVKFTPPCNYIRILTHLNIYIETLNSGQLVFRILEGSTGLPGEMLGQFNVTPDNLHVGWNMIEIPYISIPDSTSECFFISIFEMACLAAIGKDTDTAGNSWITTGGGHIWDEINDGNIMMRTYIYPYEGSDAIELAPASISISCYPNPFNPELTISFNLKETRLVKLDVYNIRGQKVKSLVAETFRPDDYNIVWKGDDNAGNKVSSGVYYIRLQVGEKTVNRKVILMK